MSNHINCPCVNCLISLSSTISFSIRFHDRRRLVFPDVLLSTAPHYITFIDDNFILLFNLIFIELASDDDDDDDDDDVNDMLMMC